MREVLLDFYRYPEGSIAHLPLDSGDIVDNLRLERYATGSGGLKHLLSREAARSIYYFLRPMLSDSVRGRIQRLYFRNWQDLPFPRWPVDTSVEEISEGFLLSSMKSQKLERLPFIWFWPDGAPAAAMITHDVEAAVGAKAIPQLMDVDSAAGIVASFQLVPEERYPVPHDLLGAIRKMGFEVNVHSLNHDGNLFRDKNTFLQHAKLINRYVRDFEAEGFRSACMYRNVDWFEKLDISYDMSMPNVAHLEPQRGGCCTVFPYFIGDILELPLTTIQDYSLLHILRDCSLDLWKKQIRLVAARHGLVSFIVHPDYIFADNALRLYKNLLAHLSQLREEDKMWIARPGDINRWWRQRSKMRLVQQDGTWCIQGEGCERARIAFATIGDEHITYNVQPSSQSLTQCGTTRD